MFKFDNSKIYLMPPYFGGSDSHDAISADVTALNFTIVTDGKRLANYLPTGFTLLKPELNISYLQQREVAFMAGGAYNLINIAVPARFSGNNDQLDGSFTLVVWENDTRPITGGREQSGQPKTYANIQDLQKFDNNYFSNTTYQNNTFLQLGFSNPQPISEKELAQLNAQVSNINVFGWRYMPEVAGPGAELSQPVLYPQSQKFTSACWGDGTVNWTKIPYNRNAYLSDIIIQANIIEQLADLPVISMGPALMTKGSILMQPLTGRALT